MTPAEEASFMEQLVDLLRDRHGDVEEASWDRDEGTVDVRLVTGNRIQFALTEDDA